MKHAIKILKLDHTKGNVVTANLPVGARVIGCHVAIEDPKLVLAGRAKPGSVVPAMTIHYDLAEQRFEPREFVLIESGKAAELPQTMDELLLAGVVVQPGKGTAWAIYEVPPTAGAVDVDGSCSPRHLSGAMDGGGPP